MTSKERVQMAVSFEEPDRPPAQIYTTPEIHERLTKHFGGRDIIDVLGIDFRSVGPAWRGSIMEPNDGIHYDIWGAGYRPVRNEFGTYDEACDLALARIETMEDVERYPWPNVEDYDYSTIEEQCDRYADFAVCLGGAGSPDILNGVSRGRGMEQVIVDIGTGDEVGMAVIDRRVDFMYEMLKRGLEAANGKVDILCLGEDCGNQNGRMFSPDTFDRVFVPRLKRFYDLAHEYGAKAMMHSCGDNYQIIPTFIEMGLDILDAMQPEPAGMDPETLKREFGDRIAFCGLISTQHTLPHGTVEDCRREARHRIDVIGKGGGYIFTPAHCIQPDTPVENVLAIYEELL